MVSTVWEDRCSDVCVPSRLGPRGRGRGSPLSSLSPASAGRGRPNWVGRKLTYPPPWRPFLPFAYTDL